MKLHLTDMTAGLAVAVTATVAVTLAAGAYVYSHHHYQTLLESARGTALAEGGLIRAALEHQMMENDRRLIDRMVRGLKGESGVENVLLLDRDGTVRYTSGADKSGSSLSIGSPTCQACHRFPPAERKMSRIIETRNGTLLRTVLPIHNRPPCHRCHDPSHEINGILIVDVDAGEIRASMNRDLRWMAAGSGALTLVLVLAIGLIVRLVVLRRLKRFETTARRIAGGDLNVRVPSGGNDTIAWLAREFNTMADSMTGLLAKVRNHGERLETIINGIDDGILVLDADRQVVAANHALLRRAGAERGVTLDCPCGSLAPGMCTSAECPTLRSLQTGRSQVRICERRTQEGETAWEEVHTSPIFGPDGEVIYVVEVWRDISDRRRTEARLADSHRLASLGMLASGFSHELNTPLATVLTCVEGILREMCGPENAEEIDRNRVREQAGIARDQLLRCRGITQHFLRLSKNKNGAGELVDLETVAADVVRLIQPTARAHSVNVELRPVAPETRVRAADADLQHVLLNLLLNAVEACKAGGRVALEVVRGDPVTIRVTDDGCGIAPQDQRRVFEPFWSLRKGGTGLGLFLSLDFIRRWGGDITVRSTLGAGSTFEVTLPAAGPAPEAAR